MSAALTVLTRNLSAKFGMGDSLDVIETLKATAFRGNVTDAQMTALLVVANQYGLNPWTKEIYAFPDKNNGIVPVVGLDGWARIINEHPAFDGMEFEQGADFCTCIMYRKDRSRPIKVTEWMEECRRNTQPWQSHPRRMLRHKATIQCARLAFGFVGIFDEDEAERIREAGATTKFMGAADVVQPPAAPAPPPAAPTWPDDAFAARLPKWQEAINSGRSHDDILAFARTKGALRADQEAAIRALVAQQPQEEGAE
jgi:phage recombination protein Bet